MDGYLFEGASPVHVLPAALVCGGAWEGHPVLDPPMAHDDDLIKRVYEYLKTMDAPVLLDVGASSGGFSLLPALIPALKVYAFEPNRDVFALLEQHIRMNHLEACVFANNFALWNEDAELTLSIPLPTATGCATLGTPNGGVPTSQQTVHAYPLDWCMGQFSKGLPHVDFIKIDVEGAEKFVLQGAEKLIARYRPVLLVECTWTTGLLFDYPTDDILRLVESYDYRWEWVKEGNAWCIPN